MPAIVSSFDTGVDGWSIEGDVAQFEWQPTGGNPGGYIYWVDQATGADSYYVASSAYLGDQSSFYGGTLSYDIEDTGSDYAGVPDITLTGDGLTLDYTVGQAGTTWTHYAVPLTAAGWTVSDTGAAATAQQMQQVLGDLTDLTIRAEYVDGNETGGLDNVVLAAACYCPGTLIATPRGEIAIEHLAAGDLVTTVDGAHAAIRWIGRRRYAGRFIAGNHLMLPVTIQAGAFAPGVPHTDLTVSPGHAMFVDGQLVPAWRLINGVSVMQAPTVDVVTYIHLDLADHQIILANGAPAESFLDDHCRGQFQNAAEFQRRYPDAAPMVPLAPRLEDGFALQNVQERIAARAGVSRPPEPIGQLRGFIDIAGPERVTGWALDEERPDEPVTLEVLVNDRPYVCLLANAYRADLRQANLGSGCHAFAIELPDGAMGAVSVRRVTDGAHLATTAAASSRRTQHAA
jgi:hypothetical protein